ncbi:hypothetical protein MRBLMA1_004131 [Sphingobium sp. LMA1-1-1.1]|uniref:hypothetical protein n=1 Tax=Sphingobium sp. LMA1-1-1.1 TaxID=3135238 RepID=UPI003447BBE6
MVLNDFCSGLSISDSEISFSWLSLSSTSIPAKPFSKAFSALQKVMEECLHSRCKSDFYIFSGDPGTCKSTTVHGFIRRWKQAGFPGAGSVIIMLGTFDEIDSYRRGCGLGDFDFACVSADAKYNAYGLGRDRAGEARVLFTTHQQVRQRMLEFGGFEGIDLFHYQGRPRSLRFWDEGLDAALPVSFSLEAVDALPAFLRGVKGSAALIDAIRLFRFDAAQRKTGNIISVPADLRDPARNMVLALKDVSVPVDILRALEGLAYLAGQQAVLRRGTFRKDGDLDGLVIVGGGQPLPDDLAPLIILDGSARLRPSYRYWAMRSGNVTFLPKAIADYSSMELHWWNKGAGKTLLADPVEREKIVNAAVELLNGSGEEWLVIHQKKVMPYLTNPGFCVAEEIKAKLDNTGKVHFLHWGKHLASNAYRNIGNVLIIGGNDYAHESYEAIYMAATGKLTDIDNGSVRTIGAYEFAHHVYQAACRSNLRNMVHETAGRAKVYLIAANRRGRQEALAEAFEGCAMHDWLPVTKKPTKKDKAVMDAISALFDDGRTSITTKEIWMACGAKDASYLTGIWKKPVVVQFMAKNGISKVGNSLRKIGEPERTIH